MSRLSLQVFYLWRHVLSTLPPFILWWSNLEIIFAPLHCSSPFIGGLRCEAIQTEHGPYIGSERTQKAVNIVRCQCDCAVGWVYIGIRTTVRLGKVHFVAKVCKICLKTFLVHWPLPDRYTLLGPCSMYRYGSQMIFSQYRVYGYQKTQNFT
jgi:hypothetical protein